MIEVKDIDTYYIKDLKCQDCGEPLRLLSYDRVSDEKGHHFIAARMWCNDHKNSWVQPNERERIYLDGPNATFAKNLEDAHNTLALLASTMEGKDIPLAWKLSVDFWGFRLEYSDALKAKLQILHDYEGGKN